MHPCKGLNWTADTKTKDSNSSPQKPVLHGRLEGKTISQAGVIQDLTDIFTAPHMHPYVVKEPCKYIALCTHVTHTWEASKVNIP